MRFLLSHYFKSSPHTPSGWGDLVALMAGCLLPFAFAPFHYFLLAVFTPALLLSTWEKCSAKRAAWRGWYFGLGLFGVGISWVYISIHTYGNTPALVAGLLTALFIATLALFPALQAYVLTRYFPRANIRKYWLAFPSSWVLLEWVRSWFLTGFPWLFLGASQVSSPLHGYIPIIGEYGTSFLVALSAAFMLSLITALSAPTKTRVLGCTPTTLVISSSIGLIFIWLLGASLCPISWTQTRGTSISVSLVQGNIPQQLKWDPAYVQATIDHYYHLTQPYWQQQLIIWPEAAIPLLYADAQPLLEQLTQLTQQQHSTLITGIPVQQGFNYYNGLIILGKPSQLYYKRHLVPFGEYVPLEQWLRGLIGFFNIPMSSFSPGPEQQTPLRIRQWVIAPFICYEIAYAPLLLNALPQANLIVNISDDAWFGHSFAAAQQLQLGQVRALESGRYALFSSNNGITAIVSPHGSVQARAPAYISTVLTGSVQAMSGSTPFVRLGLGPLLSGLFLLLIIVWGWELKRT